MNAATLLPVYFNALLNVMTSLPMKLPDITVFVVNRNCEGLK